MVIDIFKWDVDVFVNFFLMNFEENKMFYVE